MAPVPPDGYWLASDGNWYPPGAGNQQAPAPTHGYWLASDGNWYPPQVGDQRSPVRSDGYWLASDGNWYPPQVGNPRAPAPGPRKKRRAGRWIGGIIGVWVLVVAIATIADPAEEKVETGFKATAPSATTLEPVPASSAPPATTAPTPSYSAFVVSYAPLNPATLQVLVIVTNTGLGGGAPSCFVQAEDASGTYKGYDWFRLDPIAAGESHPFTAQLVITNEGAAWVTEASVRCE